jgi:hypothetical protein
VYTPTMAVGRSHEANMSSEEVPPPEDMGFDVPLLRSRKWHIIWACPAPPCGRGCTAKLAHCQRRVNFDPLAALGHAGVSIHP